jgi:hypothetical protein
VIPFAINAVKDLKNKLLPKRHTKIKYYNMSIESIDKDPRENRIIYSRVTPITAEVKSKINTAFEDVVNRFKDKHLS